MSISGIHLKHYVHFFLKDLFVFYLKGRVMKREREKNRSFIHWFTFQMAIMARVEPG